MRQFEPSSDYSRVVKMKIAVLSDIHGNLPAFEAVLSDCEKRGIVTKLILGDLITDYPQFTREIISLAKSCDYVIRGNREGYILDNRAGRCGDSWSKFAQFSANQLTYERLSESDLDYISALPAQISLKFPNLPDLRMVHGSPFSEFDTLY